MVTVNETQVKKDLYKSKAMATFSHYTAGNLYYQVELEDGIYQFPISMVDDDKLVSITKLVEDRINENKKFIEELAPPYRASWAPSKELEITELTQDLSKLKTLSEDLGTTTFSAEIRGSELSRWISKAIKAETFIKLG